VRINLARPSESTAPQRIFSAANIAIPAVFGGTVMARCLAPA